MGLNLHGLINKKNPTLVKLDRILATSCWDTHYRACFAWLKARVGSDHSPIILDTGERGEPKNKYFYFLEKWLLSENFSNMVREKWEAMISSLAANSYSLDSWHGCLQSLRKFLRGWNLKNLGEQRSRNLGLTRRVEEIDLIAEQRLLSMEEWEERISLENKL